ncbi:EVE domain protein [Pirellula sp. SH-Sr6A]|uniref:EVE domain-containing protein n=1 Tax=Pirellula sp. SH-Sr6A TaxID=1632865 RepID=UPI00078B3A24|nr:EVE domain-containing protein [Pirellula sp. SH-Sr6A]AMV32433.1 EVE domain protein [Pirellula sp. SH-Sr6A]
MNRAVSQRYWLMKTEPDVFSIDDLKNSPNQSTCWDGVRNYQARNFMRDDMRIGDKVLVYHSNAEPSCVVGIATICREAYPDHTAWDPTDPHFDPKTDPANPRWMMVDIRYESKFNVPQSLAMLRELSELSAMELLRKGSRLSVQPVRKKEFDIIVKRGKPA